MVKQWVGAMLVVSAAFPHPAKAQQTLTLADALRRADEAAYANRIAEGGATESSAGSIAALRGVLPTLRVESGWARTTDPIGVFGTKLRQRSITQADFDPAKLNFPSPVSNWASALVVEQPLINADAHLGRVAASRASDAARASADWTRSSTRLDVVRAYYGAVLAAERVATLEAASRAATAHVGQAEAMVESGMVTRSDVLLARVKAGEIETELASARGDEVLARRQLALLLGSPGDTTLAVPATLPDTATVRAALVDEPEPAPAERADVRAARFGLAAARSDLARARSLYLPRINAFARFDWFAADAPFGGRDSWTAGIMATWTPFAGASQIAEIRAASGKAEAARAGADAAEARARLETERADIKGSVALERLDIARDAVVQSSEAHRIVAQKYDGGLATVVELLDAAAMETSSGLGLSFAVYEAIVAEAERRQARGLDVGALGMLDTEPTMNR